MCAKGIKMLKNKRMMGMCVVNMKENPYLCRAKDAKQYLYSTKQYL